MSKEQKKEILRLMELSYNLGQDNIRTGNKVSLVDLYEQFEDRLKNQNKRNRNAANLADWLKHWNNFDQSLYLRYLQATNQK